MAKPILVVGPGHAHNELLTWLINSSRDGVNDYPLMWEFYPGPFGTFIRHSEDWNTYTEYPEYTRYYDDELRNGENDDESTREQLDSLISEIRNMYTDDKILCQYMNCLNLNEVAAWATEQHIPVACSYIDLPNSNIRSHYVQMEFSIGAAEDQDYDQMNFDLIEVCDWLYSKHRQNERLKTHTKNVHFFNINDFLDEKTLEKSLTSLYNTLSINNAYFNLMRMQIEQFKFINEPAHPLMQQINEMSWGEIVTIAKKGRK